MKIQRAHLKMRHGVRYQTQSGLYSCSWLPFGMLFSYAHGQSRPLLQSVMPQVYPNLTARTMSRRPVDGHCLSTFTKVLNVLKGGKTLFSGDLEIYTKGGEGEGCTGRHRFFHKVLFQSPKIKIHVVPACVIVTTHCMFSSASRRNTVLPEASPVGPLVVAKKSTAGSAKRGAYKQREDGAKHARITIDDDDGKDTFLSCSMNQIHLSHFTTRK